MKSLLVCTVLVAFAASTRYDFGDLLQNYSKNVPPKEPVTIEIGFYMWTMRINERNELIAGLYMRQSWDDERLAGLDDTVILYGDTYKTIWRPELFFRDATVKFKNDGIDQYQYTRIKPTGKVWHVMSVDAVIPCRDWYLENNAVKYFTNHSKICSLSIESFGFSRNEMNLTWMRSALEFDNRVREPRHYLNNFTLGHCTETYLTGSYSCLELSLPFHLETYSSAAAGLLCAPVFLTLIMPLIFYAIVAKISDDNITQQGIT